MNYVEGDVVYTPDGSKGTVKEYDIVNDKYTIDIDTGQSNVKFEGYKIDLVNYGNPDERKTSEKDKQLMNIK